MAREMDTQDGLIPMPSQGVAASFAPVRPRLRRAAKGSELAPPEANLATARHLRLRVAGTTLQFVRGRVAAARPKLAASSAGESNRAS